MTGYPGEWNPMQVDERVAARKPPVSLINTADLLLAELEGELSVSQRVPSDIEAMKRNAQQALKAGDSLLSRLRLQ